MRLSLPRFNLLLLAQLVLCTAPLSAQGRLSVFNVDPSGAPTVRARFVALGVSRTISGLQPEDFRVTEDGIDVPVISVQCSDATQPQPVSLSCSIDISGSMNLSPTGGNPPSLLPRLSFANWPASFPSHHPISRFRTAIAGRSSTRTSRPIAPPSSLHSIASRPVVATTSPSSYSILWPVCSTWRSSALLLTDPTGHDITISDVQSGNTEFSIDRSELPLLIPAGVSRTVAIRYRSVGAQPASTMLVLSGEPCDFVAPVPVAGIPETVIAAAVIALPTIEGEPGDIIDVPVALRSGVNIQQANVDGFSAALRFNATLLAPIEPTPTGTIDGGERVIPLTLPATPLHDSTLALLRFRALLGNDTVTTLRLEGLSTTGGSASLLTVPGMFVLKGMCREGGARLLNVDGEVALKAILSNPADAMVAIDYRIIESGRTRIAISDLLGRTVAVPLDDDVEPGSYVVTVDLSMLPSGLYSCTLRTPTMTVSRPILVQR